MLKAKTYTKSSEITIVIGDWNSKVGCGRRENVEGDHDLSIANKRGDRLVEILSDKRSGHNKHIFYITTATFLHMDFSQLCYVKSPKTYSGVYVYSDHNLLTAPIALQLPKCLKGKHRPCIGIKKL